MLRRRGTGRRKGDNRQVLAKGRGQEGDQDRRRRIRCLLSLPIDRTVDHLRHDDGKTLVHRKANVFRDHHRNPVAGNGATNQSLLRIGQSPDLHHDQPLTTRAVATALSVPIIEADRVPLDAEVEGVEVAVAVEAEA